MLDKKFETKEEGLNKLENAVRIRNQMGGALYWNICNDDCIEIAKKLLEMGADKSEISAVLNGERKE